MKIIERLTAAESQLRSPLSLPRRETNSFLRPFQRHFCETRSPHPISARTASSDVLAGTPSPRLNPTPSPI